jgi:uncharacterized protein
VTLAISAPAAYIGLAKELIEGASPLDIRAFGLRMGPAWQHEPKLKLDNLLGRATHFLHIVDRQSASEPWFSYLIGLARGDGRPMALYRADPSWQPPLWLSGLPLFDSKEEALAFYELEKSAWELVEGRRLARASLLELGISWHAESCAQCVRDGDFKAVEMFLASGYPPDLRDKHGVPMLCLAARFKHHGIVELLLEAGCDINVQSDDRGFSSLMDAAQNGDQTLLRYLLDKGADPNLVSKDGQSALVIAVGRNDVDASKALLESGADADLSDKLGLSARKYAKLFHHPAMQALFEA